MASDKYYQKVQAYIKVLTDHLGYDHPPENIEKEFTNTATKFIDETHFQMLYNPGMLIKVDPTMNVKALEKLIGNIWQLDYDDEALQELVFESGFELDVVDYLKQFKNLKPTFVHSNTSNLDRIEKFYNEALLCYGHFNYNAAIALCAAAIENVLHDMVKKKDPNKTGYRSASGKRIEKGLGGLIETALSLKLIDEELRADARRINNQRTNILHRLNPVSAERALKEIDRTKKILIAIYTS